MRALSSANLQGSVRTFLAIAAGITLVLVPMAWLYEQTRHQTVRPRVEGLLAASSEQVNSLVAEVAANTGVVLTLPAFRQLSATISPAAASRAPMAAVF